MIPEYYNLLEFTNEPLRNVNGSAAMNIEGPDEFYYRVPEGKYFLLHCICILMVDNGALRSHRFGTSRELDNGLLLDFRDSDDIILKDLFPGGIKINGEFYAYSGDPSPRTDDRAISVRWNFAMDGVPLRLNSGFRVVATVQDDLDNITRFRMTVVGRLKREK